MNQETRTRIIAEETAKFLDPSFSQLDLSSFPDLNHPTREEFAAEDKDGLNRVVVSGSNEKVPIFLASVASLTKGYWRAKCRTTILAIGFLTSRIAISL